MVPKSSKPPRAQRATADAAGIPNLWDEDTEFTTTDQSGVIAPKSVRSAQRPALMVLSGSSAGKVLRLSTDTIVLGRSSGADLTLSDNGISRKHCELRRQGATQQFLLTDLGSTNGTLVNGERIQGNTELQPGDRIQLGPDAVLQFAFYDEAEEGLANTLYEAATRDVLTRALNRRAFQERLLAEVAYAVRHGEKLAAIALDIDHFKAVNDTYGHAAGDSVLRDVASSIASTLRSEDVFARVGGEEFVLLGRGLSLPKGVAMAERIRKLVEERTFSFEAHRFQVTVSAGVAELTETDREASGEPLLQLADGRLYAAKRQGRNRVVSTS